MPKDRVKGNSRDAGQCSDTETMSVYIPPGSEAEQSASHTTTHTLKSQSD